MITNVRVTLKANHDQCDSDRQHKVTISNYNKSVHENTRRLMHILKKVVKQRLGCPVGRKSVIRTAALLSALFSRSRNVGCYC